MSKHLKHLIEGARQVLVLCPNDAYLRPSGADFSKDVTALRNDNNRVVRGLGKTAKKYGK
jgi:hypothetical protein